MRKTILSLLFVLCFVAIGYCADYDVEIGKVTINEANWNATVELKISDKDGKVLYEGTRGFASKSQDSVKTKDEIIQSIKNIIAEQKTKQASKLKDEIKKLENKKITVSE